MNRFTSKWATPITVTVALTLAGCSSTSSSSDTTITPDTTAAASATPAARTVRLVAYDSFTPSPDVLKQFTQDTGITIEVLLKGDTGTMINTAIIAKDEPFADVMWGVDSTFLSRVIASGVLQDHGITGVPTDPTLQPATGANLVLPVDTSEVCVNADTTAAPGSAQFGFDALVDPKTKGKLVVENPATSAPGLAFLLATVAKFGEDGWQDYWQQLRDNDVKVVNGWDEAWNTEFSGAGKGKRPLVVSYSNSPVASVLFGADPAATSTPLAVLKDTCIGVVEYAGLLAKPGDTDNSADADARAVLEFLVSEQFQAQLATNLFVYPARTGVPLPEVYTRLGIGPVQSPLSVSPDRIQAMRDVWIDEWTDIVLG